MVFDFEKVMDFAVDINKLNLANLVGQVIDTIMKYQIFAKVYQKIKARDLQKITKPFLYIKSQNLSHKPYFEAKIVKPH